MTEPLNPATCKHGCERDALKDTILAQETRIDALEEALEQIGVYGCGMLSQPAALNEPEVIWLKRRIDRCEQIARAALGGTAP